MDYTSTCFAKGSRLKRARIFGFRQALESQMMKGACQSPGTHGNLALGGHPASPTPVVSGQNPRGKAGKPETVLTPTLSFWGSFPPPALREVGLFVPGGARLWLCTEMDTYIQPSRIMKAARAMKSNAIDESSLWGRAAMTPEGRKKRNSGFSHRSTR